MTLHSRRSAHHLFRLVLTVVLLSGWTCARSADIAPASHASAEGIPCVSLEEVSRDLTHRHQGEGLSVTVHADSVELRCNFQKLKGLVTRNGLKLSSTSMGGIADGLSMKAVSIRRNGATVTSFAAEGQVAASDNRVTYSRPGVVEEYSVSVEGVRQDFVLAERPAGDGLLQVELDLEGATAETAGDGVALVLERSGRRLVYQRLRVTDANDRVLNANMEASADGVILSVDDTDAQYPVRIDPTFSDAHWTYFDGSTGVGRSGDGPIYFRTVHASAVDAGGNLYIGGDFAHVFTNSANLQPASGVAKWDGNSWTSLGSGVAGTVRAMAVSGGTLYVGGDITSAGGVPVSKIAKWDGTSWSALGSGMDQTVQCLTVWKNRLYAGGRFTQAGGVAASGIASWDGSTWSAVGGGLQGTVRKVNALAGNSSKLYVGGEFASAGGLATPQIAAWDGSAWSALGAGLDGPVMALTFNGSDLYAGGGFMYTGTEPLRYVARWNGTAWSALANADQSWLASPDFYQEVYALAFHGGTLHVGGYFEGSGSQASAMLTWNGTDWKTTEGWVNVPTFLQSSVRTLSVASGNLFAGGYFFAGDAFREGNLENGSETQMSIAWFSGGHWRGLGGEAAAGKVNALVAGANGDMYLGGEFLQARGLSANRVAKLNGRVVTPLGEGVNGTVNAMAWWNNQLYVGGTFTMAGGQPAANIARWDGTRWSALGEGLAGTVTSLAVHAGQLVAGGWFNTAGGLPANNIARWNGSSWSALGSGVDSIVTALAVSGNDLYVGGVFSEVGGVPASLIARWNGISWSALGSGLVPSSFFIGVNALAVSKGKLYVGGAFSMAGNIPVANIACWNGMAWESVGAGFDTPVNSLAVSGRRLFAGGGFQAPGGGGLLPGGSPLNHIACWENGTWSPVGSGVNSSVNAMAVSGDLLYLGGDFTVVGQQAASRFAALLVGAPPVITSATTAITQVGKPFSYQITATNAPDAYSASLASPGGPLAPAPGLPGSPSLPPGLAFNATTGLLSGIPTVAGSYSIALTAGNSAGDGVSTLVLTVSSTESAASWATAAGLSGNDALPNAVPFQDGVPNLVKYAFNMNGSGPDSTILTPQGVSGLPSVKTTQLNGATVLRVEFVRSRSRGLVYTPERSSNLIQFTPILGSQTVTPIDDQWERVVLTETSPPLGSSNTAFARVKVTAP
jgi:Putative Ig domain